MPSLYGAMPHAPIYNLLMGKGPISHSSCEVMREAQAKILSAIVECAAEPEKPVELGGERWDRPAYLRALRELYDWLDKACSRSEGAVAFVRSSNTCSYGSCK